MIGQSVLSSAMVSILSYPASFPGLPLSSFGSLTICTPRVRDQKLDDIDGKAWGTRLVIQWFCCMRTMPGSVYSPWYIH